MTRINDFKEYNVAKQPESSPRKAAFWLEELVKETEKKSSKENQSKGELNFEQQKRYKLFLKRWGEENKKIVADVLSEKPDPAKACVVGDRSAAIGTIEEIYVTGNFGLFGAVMEAYNHHWNLKVCPDDFWIPVAVRIGSKINNLAKSKKVRDFFVDFSGKKKIVIDTDANSIYNVDYVRVFDQFSEKIKENIKKDEYTS